MSNTTMETIKKAIRETGTKNETETSKFANDHEEKINKVKKRLSETNTKAEKIKLGKKVKENADKFSQDNEEGITKNRTRFSEAEIKIEETVKNALAEKRDDSEVVANDEAPKKKTRFFAVVETDINCEANGYHTNDGGGDSNGTSSKTCGNLQQDFIGQQQQQQQNNAGISVRAVGTGSDPERVIRKQQQQLLLLRHASKCKLGSACTTKFCTQMKSLWQHMKKCRDRDCTTRYCQRGRCVMTHYRICKRQGNTATCEICGPVMEHIRRKNRMMA